MKHTPITVASVAAVVVLVGCSEEQQPSEPHPAEQQAELCADALADVVEAIETSWMTASMAVDEAQKAARADEVQRCLDTR